MNNHTICPICNSNNIKTMPRYANNHLVRCGKCGFVFCKPIPSADELNKYYANYSYNENYFVSPVTVKRYKEILKSFETYRKFNRILDVGCGYGVFLSVAKELGWECYGTEYSPRAVELCNNKGLKVLQGSLQDVIQQLPEMDIIVSIEVIEHVSFPATEIRNMHKVVREGGSLYITTPNFNSLSRRVVKEKSGEIHYPEHLSYFTSKTLSNLLKLNGFSPKKIETTGISISRIKSVVSSKKENPFKQNSSDEKIRTAMETKWHLKIIKNIVNVVMNLLRIGNALKIRAVKK